LYVAPASRFGLRKCGGATDACSIRAGRAGCALPQAPALNAAAAATQQSLGAPPGSVAVARAQNEQEKVARCLTAILSLPAILGLFAETSGGCVGGNSIGGGDGGPKAPQSGDASSSGSSLDSSSESVSSSGAESGSSVSSSEGGTCSICTCDDGTCPTDPVGDCSDGTSCGHSRGDAGFCSVCTCDNGTCPIDSTGDCDDNTSCSEFCAICRCDNGTCPMDSTIDCNDGTICKCSVCTCSDGSCSTDTTGDCDNGSNCMYCFVCACDDGTCPTDAAGDATTIPTAATAGLAMQGDRELRIGWASHDPEAVSSASRTTSLPSREPSRSRQRAPRSKIALLSETRTYRAQSARRSNARIGERNFSPG
jgi:hypothetical protein